jgi:hypothetical protein
MWESVLGRELGIKNRKLLVYHFNLLVDRLPRKLVDRDVQPVTFLAFNHMREALAGSGHSMFPVSRLAAAVHDCHNKNVIGLNRVEDAEWDNARQAASNVLVDRAPAGRFLQDGLDCALNARDKS